MRTRTRPRDGSDGGGGIKRRSSLGDSSGRSGLSVTKLLLAAAFIGTVALPWSIYLHTLKHDAPPTAHLLPGEAPPPKPVNASAKPRPDTLKKSSNIGFEYGRGVRTKAPLPPPPPPWSFWPPPWWQQQFQMSDFYAEQLRSRHVDLHLKVMELSKKEMESKGLHAPPRKIVVAAGLR